MRLISLAFLFNLLCLTLFSQTRINPKDNCNSFNLTVKVNNQDTGRIRLLYNSCGDSIPVTTVELKNGIAKFNGFIYQASDAILVTDASSGQYSLDGPKVIKVILEPKSMNLSYSKNDISAYDIVFNGSNSQIELDTWLKQNNSNLTLKDNIGEKFNPNLSAGQRKLISNELDSVYVIITNKIKNFVLNNRDSYVSPYLLKRYYRRITVDTLKNYYSILSDKAKHNTIGESLLENILNMSSKNDEFSSKYGSKNFHTQLKSANTFLDFTLLDVENKPSRLSNFKGKYTFVNFWATWCMPCIKNIPAYEKLKKQYSPNNQINFISISVDKDIDKWKKALKIYQLNGINFIDIDNILPAFYDIQGYPRYLILGPNGKLVDDNAPKPGSIQLINILDNYALKSKY